MLISVCCLSFGSIKLIVTARSTIALPILCGSLHNRASVTHSMSHPMGGGGVVGKKFIKGALCTEHNTFNQNV